MEDNSTKRILAYISPTVEQFAHSIKASFSSGNELSVRVRNSREILTIQVLVVGKKLEIVTIGSKGFEFYRTYLDIPENYQEINLNSLSSALKVAFLKN